MSKVVELEKVLEIFNRWVHSNRTSHRFLEEINALPDASQWIGDKTPLTTEILLGLGFEVIGHYTVMGSMIKNIGRGWQLSIGCVGTPNEMLFITEEDSIIVLHNFDYDGKLYLHKLKNIIALFAPPIK